MWKNTPFTERSGASLPIIQAPMAGGFTTPELIAAVCNAGAMGSLAGGMLPADSIRKEIHKIRELTDKPFNVNLFIPPRFEEDADKITSTRHVLQGFRDELGLQEVKLPSKYTPPLDEQIAVIIEEKIPCMSFTFGALESKYVEKLHEQGILIIGTATTVKEGIFLEEHGVDMIVAQSFEAGGHRATFFERPQDSYVGGFALIPQLSSRVTIPIIASGSIMNEKSILAALILGASAVQMGTAFLTSHEAGTTKEHKDAIRKAIDNSTRLTRAFTGKIARTIRNRFQEEMDLFDSFIPDYPIQRALTEEIQKKAIEKGKEDLIPLWCGQAPMLTKRISAAQLVKDIEKNLDELILTFMKG